MNPLSMVPAGPSNRRPQDIPAVPQISPPPVQFLPVHTAAAGSPGTLFSLLAGSGHVLDASRPLVSGSPRIAVLHPSTIQPRLRPRERAPSPRHAPVQSAVPPLAFPPFPRRLQSPRSTHPPADIVP